MFNWRIFGFAGTSDFDQFAFSRINHLCLTGVRHLYKIITKINFVVDNVIADDIADVDVVDVVVAGLVGAVALPLVDDAVPLIVRNIVVVSEDRSKVSQCRAGNKF